MHQIFNKRGIHVYILNLLCIKFNQQPIKHATYSHTASSCITGNIVRFKYSNFRQVQPAYSKKICNTLPFKNLQPDIHMFAGIQTDSDATRDKFSQNNALQITSNYLNILYKIIVLVRHEGYTGTDRRLE